MGGPPSPDGAGGSGGSPPHNPAATAPLGRQESSGEALFGSQEEVHAAGAGGSSPGDQQLAVSDDAAEPGHERQQAAATAAPEAMQLDAPADEQQEQRQQQQGQHTAQQQRLAEDADVRQQEERHQEERQPGEGDMASIDAIDDAGGDASDDDMGATDDDEIMERETEEERQQRLQEEEQERQQEEEQRQQRKLNELEAALRAPDAVMEPGVMDRLREYVMANGHPQAAVEYLTESYVGYAQMASLVCRWLKTTDPAPAAGAATPAAAPAAAGGGGVGQAPARQRLDEAFYLRQLAKERFDPQLFATVFTSGGSGAPGWLNGLIAEPEGRALVYELAGRYKNSLLLNFAIHKILMQPGREKEVAAVGGSLAGYFGVFHRLMAAKLREAAAVPDERQLAALCRGIKEDCCASQHTYVHAQQVLGELGRHPHGARFRRMSQELEEHAATLHGPVVWKMRQWFAEPGQPESHYQVAGLLSDILASSVSGSPPASEMSKLYRLYWPHQQQQQEAAIAGQQQHQQPPQPQPPPIAFLRHPRVFEVLLQGLFSPGRQLQPEAVQAYSGLLALAAAADDLRPSGPADSPADGGSGKGSAGEGSAGSSSAGSAHGGSGGSLLDLSAVPATRAALEEAAELAQRVMQDEQSSAAEMERAAAVLEYPCCAAGVLRAMGAQLTRPEYWQTAYHLLKAPPFLGLLALLVPRQPALHEGLLQLLGRTLGALGNTNHDMAKGFLNIAVQLVSAGRVFEVLRWAEEWKQRADPSLVRHLVFGILEVAAPPYSPDFAGSMLRLMMASGIRRQRLSSREAAIKALLDEFAAACAQVQFKPPLSAREAQFLQDISADRPPGY